MKQVELFVRIYYHGVRHMPFLEHKKYGKFPLKEDKDVQYFDKVPLPYAKGLAEFTPAMFSLEEKTVKQYDGYDYPNLLKYAKDRGIDTKNPKGGNLKKEQLIAKLISADKEKKPEESADALKEVEDKLAVLEKEKAEREEADYLAKEIEQKRIKEEIAKTTELKAKTEAEKANV